MPTKAVVVFSGGMDSTALLCKVAHADGYDGVLAVSFDYGQKHVKELDCASNICTSLGVEHLIVDLRELGKVLGSALTTPDVEVPEGHYAEDNMKSTVVPNRNMIMASIAAGIAVARGAEMLGLGVHAGDHFVYPDCRPRFINALNAAIVLGNEGFGSIKRQPYNAIVDKFLFVPWLHFTKDEIVAHCDRVGVYVPWHMTWSCYKGGDKHCGKCGTCVERKEAFQLSGVQDPTEYQET